MAVVLLSSPQELLGLLGPLAEPLLGHREAPLPLTGVLLALAGGFVFGAVLAGLFAAMNLTALRQARTGDQAAELEIGRAHV